MKRKLIITGGICTGILLLFWLVLGFTLAGLPEINNLDQALAQLPQAVTLTDRNGKFLEARGAVIRTIDPQTKLSGDLQNSLLIAQDCLGLLAGQKECQKLLGRKVAPLLRLAYKQVTPGTLRYRLWTWKLSRKIAKLPPADLLVLYANALQFSPKIFGVRTASWQFFGKAPWDLNLEESLLLAALAQNPELDPALNGPALLESMKSIYSQLSSRGNYPPAKKDQLQLPETNNKAWQRAAVASPITNLAIDQAQQVLTAHKRNVEQGLFITTSIDLWLQETAEKLLEEAIANQFISLGSIVIIDIAKHQPLVMAEARQGGGGSIGNQIRASYLPGTAIKPLLYLAGLLEDYTPASILANTSQEKAPRGKKDLAEVSLRMALTAHLPGATANLARNLDLENTALLYKKLGLNAFSIGENITFDAITGQLEIPFLDLVNAYAVLAQNGNYFPLSSFIAISDGKNTLESSQSSAQIVTNAVYSYIISQMLGDELAMEPYNNSDIPCSAFSAKAGASADDKNSYFIGYNGSVVVAVHVQPVATPDELPEGRVTGHSFAGALWAKMVKQLPSELVTIPQAKPFGANCVAVDPLTGGRLSSAQENKLGPTNSSYYSCFKNGTEPTDDAPAKITPLPPLPLD